MFHIKIICICILHLWCWQIWLPWYLASIECLWWFWLEYFRARSHWSFSSSIYSVQYLGLVADLGSGRPHFKALSVEAKVTGAIAQPSKSKSYSCQHWEGSRDLLSLAVVSSEAHLMRSVVQPIAAREWLGHLMLKAKVQNTSFCL